MKCPYCDNGGTKVLDSRPANENKSIRRRVNASAAAEDLRPLR